MNKFDFLQSITKPTGEFKRLNKISPLRYPGGKTKAVGLITQYLPDQVPKKILSPFIGGASLEIAWANNLDDVEEVVGGDVFYPLVNFWQVILSDPNALADELEKFQLGDTNYRAYKQILKDWYEDPTKNKLTDIEAAAHYYYNMQLSYGPMFLGWTSPGKPTTKNDYDRIVQRIREFRCPKLKVELISFEQILDKYPDHFVYADPPYLLGYDSTVFKAIYPNQGGEHHKGFNHELFRDKMLERNTEWIISYNDCGTIRKWFNNYEQFYPKWQYSYQQGETRKKDDDGVSVRGAKDSRKTGDEILVVNSTYTTWVPKVTPIIKKEKKKKEKKNKENNTFDIIFDEEMIENTAK
jgi:DNA adenine methylase